MRLWILWALSGWALAQWTPQWALYTLHPGAYSPALIGTTDYVTVFAHGRWQWTGLEGAPTTYYVGASAAIQPTTLLGIGWIYDALGPQQWNLPELSLAHQTAQMLDGTLWMGVRLQAARFTLRGCDLEGPQDDGPCAGNDPLLPAQTISSSIGGFLTLSAAYQAENMQWFITLPAILQQGPRYPAAQPFRFQRALIAGGHLRLNAEGLWEWMPHLLVKYDFLLAPQIEGGLLARYNERFYAGLHYRGPLRNTTDALALTLGIEFSSFLLGYTYEVPVGPLARTTSGGHELFLRFYLPRPWSFPTLRTIYTPRFL